MSLVPRRKPFNNCEMKLLTYIHCGSDIWNADVRLQRWVIVTLLP